MAIDINTQLIREISDLGAWMSQAMERVVYGSYSERTPHLGKMRTCPHCHRRRREFGVIEEPCCNPSHAKSVDRIDAETGKHYQAECEPRVTDISTKKLVKRFTAKHHSNKKRKQIHDLSLEFQNAQARNTTQLLLEGLVGFHTPIREVDIASIPSFSEKVLVAGRKARARTLRNISKLSRKRNRG